MAGPATKDSGSLAVMAANVGDMRHAIETMSDRLAAVEKAMAAFQASCGDCKRRLDKVEETKPEMISEKTVTKLIWVMFAGVVLLIGAFYGTNAAKSYAIPLPPQVQQEAPK